jgi:hypothetical protein
MEPETSEEAGKTPASQDASATQPGAPEVDSISASTGPATDAIPVVVAPSSWIQDDGYVRTVMYMSATGKRPSVHSPTNPLRRPNRFHASSPVRSLAILTLVAVLIVAIPIGVVMADRAASSFTLPSIPGISGPTATPVIHTTVTPTATPKAKKK